MKPDVKRRSVIEKLIEYGLSLEDLEKELANFDWDADETLVRLRPVNIINVLQRFVESDISSDNVHNWAELIELRDDIEISDDEEFLRDIVLELANPLLFGKLSVEGAQVLISKLVEVRQ